MQVIVLMSDPQSSGPVRVLRQVLKKTFNTFDQGTHSVMKSRWYQENCPPENCHPVYLKENRYTTGTLNSELNKTNL